MADTKISALGAGSTPSAGDTTFVAVQGGANVKLTDAQIAAGVKATYGLTKNNAAGSDPAVGNDNTQGYSAGSIWLNTSTGLEYVCRDASTGAAVWLAQAVNLHPGYVSASWMTGPHSAVTTGNAVAADTLYAHIFQVFSRLTISTLGLRIVTGVSGTALLGVYSNSAARPLTLLVQGSGAASTTTSATDATTAVSGSTYTLEPGVYWCVSLFSAAPTPVSLTSNDPSLAPLLGGATLNSVAATNTSNIIGYTAANLYVNGLPGTFPAATAKTASPVPIVAMKVN